MDTLNHPKFKSDTVGCMHICNFDVLNIDFKSINLDSTIIAQLSLGCRDCVNKWPTAEILSGEALINCCLFHVPSKYKPNADLIICSK